MEGHVAANKDNFTLFFSDFIIFSFPYVIILLVTSSAVMNKHVESGYPCLALNFRGKFIFKNH